MEKNKMSKYILESYGKEKYMLVVRKHVASFIEKILRCQGLDFRHDIFKQVVYGEIPYKTAFEEKWKCYYDSFIYLMLNVLSPFTRTLLNRFLFLLSGTLFDDFTITSLVSKAYMLDNEFNINDLVEFYLYAYKYFIKLNETDRFIASWMFLNYFLVRHNIPCIKLIRSDFEEYVKLRDYALSDE